MCHLLSNNKLKDEVCSIFRPIYNMSCNAAKEAALRLHPPN